MKKNIPASITKIQWATIGFAVFLFFYEFYFMAGSKANAVGPLIRIDLLFLVLLLVLGLALSLFQFWQKQKTWGALIIGLIFGSIISTSVLWHQIENRYDIGQNNGYLSGSFDMAYFLHDHLRGKKVDAYGVKYFDIKPIEKNGVRTFVIIGLEE
jgi:hypothetical protein